MTEVKTESQSTRITQTQPSIKRQTTKLGTDKSIADPTRSESLVESTTDAPPAKKRRTAKTEKVPTTKRQATNKTPNQSASTRVKLSWEATPSIEAVLTQFNEQLNATWSAIDELKATVEKMQEQDAMRSTSTNVRLPLEPPRSAPVNPPQPSMPPRPTTNSPGMRSRRRKTSWKSNYAIVQRLLKLPDENSALVIDAALWILAAAGLRVGLSYLVILVPILKFPVILFMFVPALLAAYAAVFIPQANRAGIYRLLLVTLGLFVGGKL